MQHQPTYLEFLDDSGCIVSHKQLLKVVNDHLVHPCEDGSGRDVTMMLLLTIGSI